MPQPVTASPPRRITLRIVQPAFDDELGEIDPSDQLSSSGSQLGSRASSSGFLAPVLPLVFEPTQRPSRPDGQAVVLPMPPTSMVAAQAITALLEVLTRRRPARHLLSVAAPEVVARLERRARLSAPRSCEPRPKLRRLRMTHPSPGTAEISAVIAVGQRCRALALRMDWTGSRWLVTVVEGF